MTKEQIREIFIEEATEIIEKLSVDIINFEENPEDKELLNELFRGVHTLKGSANSFGFNRLGEFVHHFEDVLDYYRSSDDIISPQSIDIFLMSVDIIKDVMWLELDGDEGLPEKFNETLEAIKTILTQNDSDDKKEDTLPDLATEFCEAEKEDIIDKDITHLQMMLENDDMLYQISLTLDNDIYFRGLDHAKFFKLLTQEGKILESWWDMQNIPPLDSFDVERSTIKSIDIFFSSAKTISEIEEIFEYIDEDEYSIKIIQKNIIEVEVPHEKTIEYIEPIEQKKDTKNVVIHKKHPKKGLRSFVKIDTNKLDELFDSVGELVIAQNYIAENREIKEIKNDGVVKTINHLSKITRLIQSRVMSLRMVMINDTFEKMKRVTRDASKKLNKEISLEISGSETEIDKTMIDALSDPLIHIIRNAIDHGIEDDVSLRETLGKAEVGVITLKAFHRGGNIVIEVHDDGRGINRDKIFAKALEKEIVKENDELSDSQVFALIMQAGFSTADTISDISGRGVGLDVVRTSIEKLQGRVEISSQIGKGSTFSIILPLTLAIIDGMVVRSANDTFIIPTLSVLESFIPPKKIVHSIKHQGEFVDLRGDMIPVVRLNHVLEISDDKPEIWESTLICVESEKDRYAILVDDLIGRQQVVIKSLGPTLSKIKELSGSAIMGSGEIALILNIEKLLLDGGSKN